ncbi:MAG TPA: hypothetical protein VKY85_20285 [Candidatus Angelobacter sp.]|nr:hypothetical protein [Candidatus Angelobacter sp.]
MSPDWAAKATAVPYAEFSDPQSLNLYSYVRNVPTSKADTDGHCEGDQCTDITVTVQVTSQPAFRTNEKQSNGTYETGVRGQLTITLTKDGKPMANVPVSEKISSKTTKNDKSKVKFTEAVRPRPGDGPYREIPVCTRCEATYGRDAFPQGTKFQSDQH